MSEQSIPDYAEIVIVPVANPATANSLLQLGLALAHPETGQVIALTISLGDVEREAKTLDEIEPICNRFIDEGHKVELQTRTAPSVARGILDAVREENADLVVLGLKKPDHGKVEIGAIPESVAATAPCDVLIYRTGNSSQFNRIVVPANGSDHSRIAARVGILLGDSFDKPVEALYVQSRASVPWEGHGRLETALRDLPGQQRVKRSVVTDNEPVSGLLSRINEDDLLVLGYSKQSELQRWLYTDFSRDLLNRAAGPVILTSRYEESVNEANPLVRLVRWARPTLTHFEQDELVRQAGNMAAASLDYTVLIVVSALLASFGLLINSGAVIIGAMLVAPLMSPLIAFSVGITTGRIRLVRRSALSVFQGFALAFLIALLIGIISPSDIITPEMAGRGNPTVLDMGVALASGIIGAYATARKDIPAALAGVAIAAALMPPVCTIALGVAYDDMALARGATLLFTTNIVSIILAAWGVFFWLGLRPQMVEESRVRQFTSAALVILFAAVASIFYLREVNPNTFEAGIEQQLRASFEQDVLVDFEIRRSNPLQVIAIVRRSVDRANDNQEVLAARAALQANLQQPVDLEVVIEPFYSAEQILLRQHLDAVFPYRLDVEVDMDNPVRIVVTVPRAKLATAETEAEALRTDLEQALARPVNVIVIEDGTTPLNPPVDPLPEATAEATEAIRQ